MHVCKQWRGIRWENCWGGRDHKYRVTSKSLRKDTVLYLLSVCLQREGRWAVCTCSWIPTCSGLVRGTGLLNEWNPSSVTVAQHEWAQIASLLDLCLQQTKTADRVILEQKLRNPVYRESRENRWLEWQIYTLTNLYDTNILFLFKQHKWTDWPEAKLGILEEEFIACK